MLKNVGRIRLVSELASDPWTTTREAATAEGEARLARIGRAPVQLDAAGQARFDAECEATRALESAFLAPVLDHGVSFSMPWITHPRVNGRPLAVALEDAPAPLDPSLVALIGADVAAALEAAHGAEPPLAHLGLGPDTVWLDADQGGARVIGFGLSRLCVEAGRAVPAMRDAMARLASPEQAANEAVGPASDLYSLAALLVSLATGEVRPAASLDADALDALPPALRAPLARALERDPGARGDAAALRLALRALVDDEAAARDALAERFVLEGRRDTDPPPAPEGAPARGLPLESVTKEQLLPEARASYRTYGLPGAARPSWADSTEDDAFDDDPFAPLAGEGTRVDTSIQDEALRASAEDFADVSEPGFRDTKEVALPDLSDMPEIAGLADLPELPTVVHGHHLPSIAPDEDPDAPPPLERTLELPSPPDGHGYGGRATVPTLPPGSFRVSVEPPAEAPSAPPPPPRGPMMIAGWPVTWLIGMGAGAAALVAAVAVLTAFLASC